MTAMDFPQRQFTITGRKVLFWIIGFFGVIFAVNGVFLYFAIDSWPGLTSDKAYVEGLQYNQVLADAEQQAITGWQSSVEIEKSESGSVVRLSLTDSAGAPLASKKPILSITRPVGQPEPITAAAHETVPGVYETMTRPLDAGRWSITVQVGNDYHLKHEVWIKP